MQEAQKWKESSTIPPEPPPGAEDRRTPPADGATSATDYHEEIAKLRQELARIGEVVSASVQSTVQPVARELEGVIVRNPTASVAIAAGAGLLIGIMMKR